MKRRSLIFLLMAFIRNFNSQTLSVEDSCTLAATGGQGICQSQESCTSAKSLKLDRQNCHLNSTHPLVCCPKKFQRIPGVISKQKCREYSGYTKVNVGPITLTIDAPSVIVDDCGHSALKLTIAEKPAEDNEFPHIAAIGYETKPGKIDWRCGGTILSNKFILTSGQCLFTHLGMAKYVRIGAANLNDNENTEAQQIKIAKRIAHPQFNWTFYHDIALLELEEAAKLSSHVLPACLYAAHDVHDGRAIAIGWPYWQPKTPKSGKQLLKATLDLFEHKDCYNFYHSESVEIIDDIHLCTVSSTDREDENEGTSGTPLQIYHDSTRDNITCMYDVVGIAAFGSPDPSTPAVYTRVSHYIKWIEDIVWPED